MPSSAPWNDQISYFNTGDTRITRRLILRNSTEVLVYSGMFFPEGGIEVPLGQGGGIRLAGNALVLCGVPVQVCCRTPTPGGPLLLCYAYLRDRVCPIGQQLPVELVRLTAQWISGRAAIQWRTASELNNAHFEVQRSADGRTWEVVGVVQGAGTSTVPRSYEFVDLTPGPDRRLYRLRQVDLDGTFEFSPIVELQSLANADQGFSGDRRSLFPNPTSGRVQLVQVDPNGNEDAVHRLRLVSSTGALIRDAQAPLAQGKTLREQAVQALPRGLYLLQVSSGQHTQFIRLIRDYTNN